jgi:hypothetical protein
MKLYNTWALAPTHIGIESLARRLQESRFQPAPWAAFYYCLCAYPVRQRAQRADRWKSKNIFRQLCVIFAVMAQLSQWVNNFAWLSIFDWLYYLYNGPHKPRRRPLSLSGDGSRPAVSGVGVQLSPGTALFLALRIRNRISKSGQSRRVGIKYGGRWLGKSFIYSCETSKVSHSGYYRLK